MRRRPAPAALPALTALLLACADREASPADTAAPAPAPVANTSGCTLGPAEVDSQAVGGVRLGMTVAALRGTCPAADTVVTLGDGILEPGLVVSVGSARAIARVDGDTVTRIMVPVRGPTANGVGVGSRIGALRRLHGRVCGAVGEGRIVVAAARLPGVSFATTASYARYATDSAALLGGRLPDTARITGLSVPGGTGPCVPR